MEQQKRKKERIDAFVMFVVADVYNQNINISFLCDLFATR